MDEKDKQLQRITGFESVLDQGLSATKELSAALDRLGALLPALKRLEAYFTGDLWKRDFADDEAGLLPQSLKRGVLSEDAVNDLLDALLHLNTRMAALAAQGTMGD